MAPIPEPERSYREEVIEASRKNFANDRKTVEEDIRKWHEPINSQNKNNISTAAKVASVAAVALYIGEVLGAR